MLYHGLFSRPHIHQGLQEVVRVDGRQDEQEMRRWERREAGESDREQTCALVATTAGPPDEVITYRG